MGIVIAMIPARFASTRLPGKPLVEIAGCPMIQHVYERTRRAARVDRVIVATDDQRIADTVAGFGGDVVMASTEHRSGTDRIAAALRDLQVSGDGSTIVVNVQGDEPLVDPDLIDRLVETIERSGCDVATAVGRIESSRELFDTNVVKAVLRADFTPLYFSRSPIPCLRDLPPEQWLETTPFYKHIGIYAFGRNALDAFVAAEPTALEVAEGLEQLRMLDLHMTLLCVETEYAGHAVDTPEDVMRVEAIFAGTDTDRNSAVGE